MIGAIVRPLCVLSVLGGVLLSLTPEGNVKRIAELACSCVLILSVLRTAGGAAPTLPSLEEEALRLEAELYAEAEKTGSELTELVIRRECEAYLMEKADALGIVLREVTVGLRLTEEHGWTPWSVLLDADATAEKKSALSGIIRTDLGIPYERQSWHENG